jgi:hypothetical protein
MKICFTEKYGGINPNFAVCDAYIFIREPIDFQLGSLYGLN